MINQAVDLLGITLGIVFIVLSINASHSLVGSAFKRYHYWMMGGTIAFVLAFIADFTASVINQVDAFDAVHHILLLIAAAIFIITNLRLPQEASQYLDLQNKGKKEGGA